MHVHVERECESLDERLELISSECQVYYCDFRHSINLFLFFGHSTKLFSCKFKHI